MKISEIFCSINGESAQAGKRTVFIRTFGCNLRCTYCDSMYAVEGEDYQDMTVDKIVEEVKTFNCSRVTFTGGEPLMQKDALDLICRLYDEMIDVEIETNGAVGLGELEELRQNGRLSDCVMLTMDWKCPSSGMNQSMLEDNLRLLRRTDVLKCVVGSLEDLEEMMRVRSLTAAQVYVSPIFDDIEPKQIADYLLQGEIDDVTLQLQQHKIIWPADMRGV